MVKKFAVVFSALFLLFILKFAPLDEKGNGSVWPYKLAEEKGLAQPITPPEKKKITTNQCVDELVKKRVVIPQKEEVSEIKERRGKSKPVVARRIEEKKEETSSEEIKALFKQGIEHYKKKIYSESYETFRLILYKRPHSFLVSYWMGRASYQMGMQSKDLGDFEESLYCYQRALVIRPEHERALFEKAKVHLALGAKEKAKIDLQKVVKTSKDEKLIHQCHQYLQHFGQKEKKKSTLVGFLIYKHEWDSNATLGTSSAYPDPYGGTFYREASDRSDRNHSLIFLLSHRLKTSIESLYLKNKFLLFLKDHIKLETNSLRILKYTLGMQYMLKKQQFPLKVFLGKC